MSLSSFLWDGYWMFVVIKWDKGCAVLSALRASPLVGLFCSWPKCSAPQTWLGNDVRCKYRRLFSGSQPLGWSVSRELEIKRCQKDQGWGHMQGPAAYLRGYRAWVQIPALINSLTSIPDAASCCFPVHGCRCHCGCPPGQLWITWKNAGPLQGWCICHWWCLSPLEGDVL